jgi:hypothetical protein
MATISELAGESACPTLLLKTLETCGAAAFACQHFFTVPHGRGSVTLSKNLRHCGIRGVETGGNTIARSVGPEQRRGDAIDRRSVSCVLGREAGIRRQL